MAEDDYACSSKSDCMRLTQNEYFVCVLPDGSLTSDASASTSAADSEPTSGRLLAEGDKTGVCEHKALWPLTGKEWLGTFVYSFIMLASNVAGIGGGGVAVPLAMYFFNFSMKPAIALSSFSIMCASCFRFVYNFNERHPEKDTPALDYGLTNVMMPLTLIGSLIGAYFYKSFPDLILVVILTLLLFVIFVFSFKKFFAMRKKESEAAAKKADKQKVEEIELVKNDEKKVQDEPENEGPEEEAPVVLDVVAAQEPVLLKTNDSDDV